MEATKSKGTWWPELFALLFLGAAIYAFSFIQLIQSPQAITVPISEINRTVRAVFPSDGAFSGGSPYLVYEDMTFETLPERAYCTPGWFRFEHKDTLSFYCGWSLENDSFHYGRADVQLTLPEVFGIWDWQFDRQNLTVNPVMMTWFGANYLPILFAALFALVAIVIEREAIANRRVSYYR